MSVGVSCSWRTANSWPEAKQIRRDTGQESAHVLCVHMVRFWLSNSPLSLFAAGSAVPLWRPTESLMATYQVSNLVNIRCEPAHTLSPSLERGLTRYCPSGVNLQKCTAGASTHGT